MYSKWTLHAKGIIRELNRGDGRKMVWSGAPKRVLNNALEFEAYVRSNTSLVSLQG